MKGLLKDRPLPITHTTTQTEQCKRSAGYTLTELLVVLIILGLLTAVVAPQVFGYLTRAKTDAAQVQLTSLAAQLDLYFLDTGAYPGTDEGLMALIRRPADVEVWNGPYLPTTDKIRDPWGEIFQYRFPGENGVYDLYSYGADKEPGGEGENGDVTNWEILPDE